MSLQKSSSSSTIMKEIRNSHDSYFSVLPSDIHNIITKYWTDGGYKLYQCWKCQRLIHNALETNDNYGYHFIWIHMCPDNDNKWTVINKSMIH